MHSHTESSPSELSVAQCIASIEWRDTPLGARQDWPGSLSIALGICLEAELPMVLYWGADFVQLYNDAYRQALGKGRHPAAYGQCASAHASEFWEAVGPMLSHSFEDGASSSTGDLLLRSASGGESTPDESYFRFSCVPVRDERGIGGVLCVATDTTAKFRQRVRVEHLHFLSEASDVVLNSMRNPTDILGAIAKTAVPLFVEWCGVYRRVDSATIETVAIEHADPELAAVARRMHDDYPLRSTGAVAAVIRTGEPLRFDDVTAAARRTMAEDDRQLSYLERIALGSIMLFPLTAFGETFGVITLAMSSHGRRLDDDDFAVGSLFAKRVSSGYENALLYAREHRVAGAMQAASLPRDLPAVPGLQLNAVYVPGGSEAQIGGDWYDAFRLRDGRIVISIGDVAGCGLDAAVTMSNMRQIIRGTAQVRADPVLMLNAADRALRLEDPSRFVTAFVGVLDPVANELTYASAGHPPPYVRYADGRLEELTFIDPPLGLRQRSQSRPKSIRLPERGLVVFYTDGVTECSRNLSEGIAALEAALRDDVITEADDPAKSLEQRLLPQGSRDDVAILTLRIDTQRRLPHVQRWRLDEVDGAALHALRRDLRLSLEAKQFGANNIASAELVLGELVGNVVRYAPGAIDVALDTSGHAPVLHVMDWGPGFERTPMLPLDVLSESGRGLFIVAALTEEFNVSRRPGRGSHARAVLTGGGRPTVLSMENAL